MKREKEKETDRMRDIPWYLCLRHKYRDVCVFERERERDREREKVRVSICQRGGERVCVYVCLRLREEKPV